VCCRVLQCVAVCCSGVACCRVMQLDTIEGGFNEGSYSELQCVAVCCSAVVYLQCCSSTRWKEALTKEFTACCSVLQCCGV